MPSGAKKRKAARRKKEMGLHPPDSSTGSSSGNGDSHDSKGETSDEGEEKKGESPRSESVTVAVMDSLDNGKEKSSEVAAKVTEYTPEPEEEKKKVVEEETVAEDAGAELVQTKDGEGGGGVGPTEVAEEKSATVASVVRVDEPVSVTEEVVEATEAAAVTLEASLVIDTSAHENEVKPAPIFDIPPAPVIEKPLPDRESGVRERSEGDRATWWNCCGLFHVLASSTGVTST